MSRVGYWNIMSVLSAGAFLLALVMGRTEESRHLGLVMFMCFGFRDVLKEMGK